MGNTATKPLSSKFWFPSSSPRPHDDSDRVLVDKDNDRSIIIVTGAEGLKHGLVQASSTITTEDASLVSSISDPLVCSSPCSLDTSRHNRERSDFQVQQWDGKTYFADFVHQGLVDLKLDKSNVVMLYESPSSSSHETSFYNSQVFNYHDFPSFPPYYKSVLAPCRYSIMNGPTFPSYLRDAPPAGLLDHWAATVPEFSAPTFTPEISPDSHVYAYLPVEHLNLDVRLFDSVLLSRRILGLCPNSFSLYALSL